MIYNYQVDMRKVNLQVMRPWIASKVTELVGFEDEVVIEYAMGLLEDTSQPVSCKSFILYSRTHIIVDARSKEDADQPYRVSYCKDSRIYVITVESSN